MPIRDFRDLIAWQKSVDLAEAVYTLTRAFPREELFGTTSQLRRAAISISSNIAEGNGRSSPKDYARFLGYAKGSVNEVRSLLVVSRRLKFTTGERASGIEDLLEELSKMLPALRSKLLRKARKVKQGTKR